MSGYPLENNPLYPLNRRTRGPQSPFERSRQEKRFLVHAWFRTPDGPSHSLVMVSTMLLMLLLMVMNDEDVIICSHSSYITSRATKRRTYQMCKAYSIQRAGRGTGWEDTNLKTQDNIKIDLK